MIIYKEHSFKDKYLYINTNFCDFCPLEENLEDFLTKLEIAWKELKLPTNKGNLKDEIQLLNARIILLFFDEKFRLELSNVLDAFNSIESEKFKTLNLKLHSHLGSFLGKDVSIALDTLDAFEKNWGVDFIINHSPLNYSICASHYGPAFFDLNDFAQKVYSLSRDIDIRGMKRVKFLPEYLKVVAVDLRYDLNTNVEIFKSMLEEAYRSQTDDIFINPSNFNPKAKQYLSPKKRTGLMGIHPQHSHFYIYKKAFKIKKKYEGTKKITQNYIAEKIINSKTFKTEEGLNRNVITTILNKLPQITRFYMDNSSSK